VIALNLTPPAYRAARDQRRRVRAWGRLLSVLIVAGVLIVANVWKDANPARAAWAAVTDLEGKIDERKRELALLRASVGLLNKELESVTAVSNHPDWTPALRLIADRLGNDVVLDSCVLDRPRDAPSGGPAGLPARKALKPAARTRLVYALELSGLATNQAAVHRYLADLQTARLFDSVTLIETRSRPLADRLFMGFRLSCEIVAPVDVAGEKAR